MKKKIRETEIEEVESRALEGGERQEDFDAEEIVDRQLINTINELTADPTNQPQPDSSAFTPFSMLYHPHADTGLGVFSPEQSAELLEKELTIQKEKHREEKERQALEREATYKKQMAAR